MTNNHVIRSADEARDTVVDFNYQQQLDGQTATMTTLNLNPDVAFATSEALDWTIVGVEGRPGDTFGIIPLKDVAVMEDEFVQIIQHPKGGEKQLAYRTNVVVDVNARHVQYLTDTMPGSSGSPVFNRNWEIVALYHASSTYQEPGQGSEQLVCNQGIHINAVLSDLRKHSAWL